GVDELGGAHREVAREQSDLVAAHRPAIEQVLHRDHRDARIGAVSAVRIDLRLVERRPQPIAQRRPRRLLHVGDEEAGVGGRRGHRTRRKKPPLLNESANFSRSVSATKSGALLRMLRTASCGPSPCVGSTGKPFSTVCSTIRYEPTGTKSLYASNSARVVYLP